MKGTNKHTDSSLVCFYYHRCLSQSEEKIYTVYSLHLLYLIDEINNPVVTLKTIGHQYRGGRASSEVSCVLLRSVATDKGLRHSELPIFGHLKYFFHNRI